MADQSIITTSREKSHLLLTDLFKSQFGELSNFDKTSFNAWIIERLTDIQRDLAITLTLEKEEQFLNTCKKIETARTIGYNYGFSRVNVEAASGMVSFTVMLPLDFKNKKLSLKADTVKMYAGDVTYMFPGDIEIIGNEKGTIQAVRRSEHVFEPVDNTILYSVSNYSSNRDAIMFTFTSEVIQLDYTESSFIVEDHIQMTRSTNEITYDNYYYRIELWYEIYNSDLDVIEKNYLLQVEDFSSYNSKSDVFMLELGEENKLTIILGDGVNGKYFGGGRELKYRIYYTNGSDGNTTNASLDVGTGSDMVDVTTYASFISNPSGGRNEYTLLELKDAIRKRIQTPGTIITDNDLKNTISDLLDLSSEETFHKLRRNDPIERILELFIIVKDRSNSDTEVVIPTNTIDVSINTNVSIDNTYNTIKPFFLIETTSSTTDDGSKLIKNTVIPTYRSRLSYNMYYTNYYAIKYQSNPPMVNFFNLSANLDLAYEKTYVNTNISEEVYINSMILERDIFNINNQYVIRITLDCLNASFLENNTLLVKARFTNNSKDIGYEDFIVDFEKAKKTDGTLETNIYEARITSLDIISDSNRLFIKDVYKKEQEFTDGTEIWSIDSRDFSTQIKDSIDCELCIFYNYDTDTVVDNKSFTNIRGIRNKLLMTSYTITGIPLYTNVDDIVYCQVEEDPNNSNYITIKNMPVYKEEYVSNSANKEALMEQMRVERNIISKLENKTEFPSRVSLKYFNTYGYSDVYSSLDNVSIDLEFEVSYKNNKTISDSEITEIKNNLVKFIDSINKKDSTEDKNIYLSDLVSIVMNNSNIIQCRVLNYTDNIYFKKSFSQDYSYIPTSLQLDPENIRFVVKSV